MTGSSMREVSAVTESKRQALVLTQHGSVAADLVSACKRAGVTPSLLTLAGMRSGSADRKLVRMRREQSERILQIGLRTRTSVHVAPDYAELKRIILSFKPTLLVVRGFPLRLDVEILDAAELGGVNFHPSPLPQFRGKYPLQHMLVAGEPHVMMTGHWMTPDLDCGPILERAEGDALPASTVEELWASTDEVGRQIYGRVIARALDGAVGWVQEQEKASEANDFPRGFLCLDAERTDRTMLMRYVLAGQLGTPNPRPVCLHLAGGERLSVVGVRDDSSEGISVSLASEQKCVVMIGTSEGVDDDCQ